MKKISNYERGFIEGMIDGEGSIEFCKQKAMGNSDNTRTKSGFAWRLRLSIANKSLKLLGKIEKICGKGTVVKKPGDNYELRYGPNIMRELLPQIKLIVKEEKRIIALKTLNLLTKGRNQYTENYDNKVEILFNRFKSLYSKSRKKYC